MRYALALPLFLAPAPALADVTPQDVWDNITTSYGAMGFTVSGTPQASGDTLVIADAAVSLVYPVIGGSASLSLPEMTLSALGDGTVGIVTPDTYAMDLRADIPDGDGEMTATVTVAQTGLSSVASGDPGDVTYTSSTDTFDLLVGNLAIPGEEVELTLEMDSEGYDTETRVQVDGNVTITSTMRNGAAVTSYNVDSPLFSQQSTTTGGEITATGTLVLPPEMDIMNLTAALKAGLSLMGEAQTGASETVTTSRIEEDMLSEQRQTVGAGNSTFSFSQDGLTLTGTGEGFAADINDPLTLPFPISIAADTLSFDFALPLVAKEEPQTVTYALGLGQLSVSDDLWGMIDGGNVLNRAPADIAIDVTAQTAWGLDLLDIVQLSIMEQTGEVPIKVLSADLRDLTLGALGAEAQATGAFTFDNDDMTTFPDFPRPAGSASLTATGINAAMDQLVAAGLVPEEDLAPARLMIGLFTRATGPDTLESTLEVNEEGHVIVNGQRMR